MPCGAIYSNRKSSDFGPPSESQMSSTLSRNMLSASCARHATHDTSQPCQQIVSNPSPWWTPLLFVERWRQNGQHPSAESRRCVSIRNEVETRGRESYHLISMLGTSDNRSQTPEAINQTGYFHLTLIHSCDCINPALSGDPWWAQRRIQKCLVCTE